MTRNARGPRPPAPRLRRRRAARVADLSRRTRVAGTVHLLVLALVVAVLVDVQVLDGDEWAARGAAQRDQLVHLGTERGRIYDRGGDLLAASVPAVSVAVDPAAFRAWSDPLGAGPDVEALDPDVVAAELAPLLDLEVGAVRAVLVGDGRFTYLGRQLDPEVGRAVEALGYPEAVVVAPEQRRVHPAGELAGRLLGSTDVDGNGVGGLELVHQDLLAGTQGWYAFERTVTGREIPIAERELVAPVPGGDLVLTIDRQVQWTAERVAAEVVAAYDAAGASVVVIEVGTGDVLAMASADGPDVDGPARNRAVTDVFEPGSVQKAITAAAALEEGVVAVDTMLEVGDRIEVAGSVFRDSHPHPTRSMSFAEVIETSSNVGTITVAQQLGEQRLAEWLDRFGFGRPTGIGLPGEAPGILRDVDDWWGTSLPTIAIGQGVATTLLQATNAYATIGNDGVPVEPRIVRGTVGTEGSFAAAPVVEGPRVLSADTATTLRGVLASVVQGERGTGGLASVDGHVVAGKTGTARKPSPDGGYGGTHVATFVGMAPADAPRVAVGVMVDEPSVIWGGAVAAPVFAEVTAEALRRLAVAPDLAGPGWDVVLTDAQRAAREARAATPASAPASGSPTPRG